MADEVIESDLFSGEEFVVPTTPAVPVWSSPEMGSLVSAQRAGIIAVFDDPEAALAAGRRVHALLVEAAAAPGGGGDIEEVRYGAPSSPPPTEPEVEFMIEIGAASPTRSFGWLGEERASGPAVSVLGGVVTVADLAYIDDDLPNPLHDAFIALGATRTIGELDWPYDLGAAADVACTVPEPVPSEELRDLADYLSATRLYDVTAPWDGSLGADQRRVRRSRRLLEERVRTAARSMFDDPEAVARSVDKAVRDGQDPTEAVRAALSIEGSMDPTLFDGIDPVVTKWFIDRQATIPSEAGDEAQWRASRRDEHSAAMGAPAVEPNESGIRDVLGQVGFASWRIDLAARPATVQIARFESDSLSRTLPHFVDHLVGIGCVNVTVDLADLDEG